MTLTKEQSGDVLRAEAFALKDKARLLEKEAEKLDQKTGTEVYKAMVESKVFAGAVYQLTDNYRLAEIRSHSCIDDEVETLLEGFEDPHRLGHELYVEASLPVGDRFVKMCWIDSEITFYVKNPEGEPVDIAEDLVVIATLAKALCITLNINNLTDRILETEALAEDKRMYRKLVTDCLPAELLLKDHEAG